MVHDYFRLDKARLAQLDPPVPTETRANAEANNRRVTIGTVHILETGDRWVAPNRLDKDLDTKAYTNLTTEPGGPFLEKDSVVYQAAWVRKETIRWQGY